MSLAFADAQTYFASIIEDVAAIVQGPTPVTFGRFIYDIDSVNTAAVQASRWPWQTLQGNFAGQVPVLRAAGALTLSVYADPVAYRQSDPSGYTQCVLPSQVQQSWILTDAYRRKISRTSNGDIMLDPGNTDYQAAAAAFLIAKCHAQGWDAVTLDEINDNPTTSYTPRPAKYGTNTAWQSAVSSFVTSVAGALHAAGFKVYGNYGGNYSPWAQQVATILDGVCTQYFVGLSGTGIAAAATVENGYWVNQFAWAQWNEQASRESIWHCSTAAPGVARFGLGTYLLVTEGAGIFSCAVNDGGDDVWTADFTAAQQLGQPTGPYTQSGNLYSRQFENGAVTVNPHSTATNLGTQSIPAASATITLS